MSSKAARRWLACACAPLLAAVSVYVAGVAGTSSASPAGARALAGGAQPSGPSRLGFAWLRPATPPQSWRLARLPASGATLAYPPSWHTIESDAGSVSAALVRQGEIRGYLNVTPQSGAETLANWTRFRPAHNREEGDSKLVLDAARTALHFRSGTGSCVIDELHRLSPLQRDRVHRARDTFDDRGRGCHAASRLEPRLPGVRALDRELRGLAGRHSRRPSTYRGSFFVSSTTCWNVGRFSNGNGGTVIALALIQRFRSKQLACASSAHAPVP